MATTTSSHGHNEIVSLAECLALPVLTEAKILVSEGLDRRVLWPAALEWPIEDFVSEGDFILTTGMGRDGEQLAEMIAEVAAAGGAAFCISTGPGAFHESLSKAAVDSAAKASIALVEIPWNLRFSDVSRAIIQLLNRWPNGVSDLAFPDAFAKALLGPSGIAGVAQALEEVVSAPVVVFDAGLTLAGAGLRGTAWLEDDGNEARLMPFLSRLSKKSRDDSNAEDGARNGSLQSDAGLTAAPALVHDGVVGWVLCCGSPELVTPSHAQAMRHAATAAAIELVRKVAADEAAFQARDALFWDVVSGAASTEFEITARAALVGIPVGHEYVVSVGLVEQATTPSAVLSTRATVNMVRRRLSHPSSVVALRDQEVLLCRHASESVTLEVLASCLPANSVTISWGESTGVQRIFDLKSAYVQAWTALNVQRALSGPGAVGRAKDLGPYMLLSHLTGDPEVRELVDRTLAPLEQADDSKNSDLIGTLAVFLACHGNISQAARDLYLNRHSLIYRLRRISEITGLDLESYEDRSLLDMAMRIRRLRSVAGQ